MIQGLAFRLFKPFGEIFLHYRHPYPPVCRNIVSSTPQYDLYMLSPYLFLLTFHVTILNRYKFTKKGMFRLSKHTLSYPAAQLTFPYKPLHSDRDEAVHHPYDRCQILGKYVASRNQVSFICVFDMGIAEARPGLIFRRAWLRC